MGSIAKAPSKFLTEILKASVTENTQATRKFFQNNKTGVLRAADLISNALLAGKTLLICGNGGSAADSQHMAAEFVGTFTHYRPGLPAIALCSDSATITALGNDFGFDRIFARQVEAHGLPGDVLIVFTTSGNSKNILLAVKEAIKRRMAVVAVAGKGGGTLRKLVPDTLLVPSMSTPRIQEVQILIIHTVCALVEARLFPELSVSRSASATFAGQEAKRRSKPTNALRSKNKN
jgi:D-sedoheptulose 7-phosphate isomerase